MSKAPARIYFIVLIAVIAFAVVLVGGYYISQVFLTSSPQSSTMPIPVVETARNWAGYISASDLQNPQPEVIGVSASWTVPTITDIGIDAFSAIWIGIGGEFDQTLIQTGTEQDWVNGQAQYSAWYELLPGDSITIETMDISSGDQIEASINLIQSDTNRWSISITDITSGQIYQNNFTYISGKLSADWIVERPEVNSVLPALADFDTITFANCQTVFLNRSGAISGFPNSEVLMDAQLRHNKMVQLVDVSELNPQGNQFTVSYLTD